MRPTLVIAAVLVAVAGSLAPIVAQATQIAPGADLTIHFYDLDQGFGDGGLFQYDWVAPNAVDDYSIYGYAPEALWNNGTGFYSFCLEENETVHYDRDYNSELSLVALNDANTTNAHEGGVGDAGDPISNATAYLYYMFATGRFGDLADGYLSPEVDGLTDAQAVRQLQEAIWSYEDEINPVTNWFTAEVDTYFGTGGAGAAFSAGDDYDPGPSGSLFPTGDGRRYVVFAVNNRYVNSDDLAQDTLFMTIVPPDTPTNTPEPAACLIWGLGLCLMGLAGRRAK